MTSLVDLLSPQYAPIQRVLLDHLNPGAIARLTCTCKAFGCLWPTLMASDYNINFKLRHFFTDPREFRSVQGQCGAIIQDSINKYNASGYFGFIERSIFEGTRLPVLVETTRMAPLVDYLAAEGYEPLDPDPTFADQENMYSATKVGVDGEMRKVELEHYHPVGQLHMIMHTHRPTHKLRFVTWNKAYTIFAYEAFVKETCHLVQSVHLTQSEDAKLWEYVTKVQGMENPECWFCTDGVLEVARDGPKSITRRIGDSQTWILNLDTTGVTVPDIPDAILESSVFELRQCSSPLVAELDGIKVEYPIYESLYVDLGHVVLKHWYVMPLGTGPSVMHKKCAAILKKLERLTRLELKKIPEAERPPEYYAFQRGEWDAMHL